MNLPQTKNITLPLHVFLNYLLTYKDKVAVDSDTALMIQAIDASEQFCHVQFVSFTGEEFEKPLVWRINDWRTSYTAYLLKKEQSEKERHEACVLSENTQLLMSAMSRQTGIDREFFRRLAHKIAARQADSAAKQFNVKLDK